MISRLGVRERISVLSIIRERHSKVGKEGGVCSQSEAFALLWHRLLGLICFHVVLRLWVFLWIESF